jgi:hypothetical protein
MPGGRTPREVIAGGDEDEVIAVLSGLASGAQV